VDPVVPRKIEGDSRHIKVSICATVVNERLQGYLNYVRLFRMAGALKRKDSFINMNWEPTVAGKSTINRTKYMESGVQLITVVSEYNPDICTRRGS